MASNKRYVPRKHNGELTVHDSVMAIKVTEKNLISTKDWVGHFNNDQVVALIKVDKHGDTSDHRIKVKTPKGWRVARVGDYVVRHFAYNTDTPNYEGNYFFSVGKDEFLENYELAKPGQFA